MKRRLILSSSLTTILVGCTPTNIRSWQIASVPGIIRGGTGKRISVRSVGLPSAMSQTSVPAPGEVYAANTFPNDLWASGLAAMLQIVMVKNLAQRLPLDTVLADGGAIGAAPQRLVEIQVLAFTPNSIGEILLSAQLATRPATSQTWKFQNFEARAPGGNSPETIVAAMSTLWGEAADNLARILG